MADINTQTKQVLDKKEIINPTKIFSEENKAKNKVPRLKISFSQKLDVVFENIYYIEVF